MPLIVHFQTVQRNPYTVSKPYYILLDQFHTITVILISVICFQPSKISEIWGNLISSGKDEYQIPLFELKSSNLRIALLSPNEITLNNPSIL